MKTKHTPPHNMDEYIAIFPDDVREVLEKVRMTIKNAAPEAVETISYQMPTFNLNGTYLIYFAAYDKHVSVYPAPIGNAGFNGDLLPYASGKGTAKFPLDKPIPFDLISKIVKFRLKEISTRATAKGKAG